jgi:hypothetical protein
MSRIYKKLDEDMLVYYDPDTDSCDIIPASSVVGKLQPATHEQLDRLPTDLLRDDDPDQRQVKLNRLRLAWDKPDPPDTKSPLEDLHPFLGTCPKGYRIVAEDEPNGLRVVVDSKGRRTTTFREGVLEDSADKLGPTVAKVMDDISSLEVIANTDGKIPLGWVVRDVRRVHPGVMVGEVLAALAHLHNQGHLHAEVPYSPDREFELPVGGSTNPHLATLWHEGRALHYWSIPKGKKSVRMSLTESYFPKTVDNPIGKVLIRL